MITDTVFQFSYLAGLIAGSIIRGWYGRKYKQDRMAIFRNEGFAVGFLATLWGVSILLPLLFIFTEWLDFADYDMPVWVGWSGILLFITAIWLLWKSHVDLGKNWSATTVIRVEHTLVTSGVFRSMRHPMYAAHLLWGIAQILLIHNWLAGFASLVIIVPLYLLRVPREEQMMLAQFGEKYRSYMDRTGRIIPRFWR